MRKNISFDGVFPAVERICFYKAGLQTTCLACEWEAENEDAACGEGEGRMKG